MTTQTVPQASRRANWVERVAQTQLRQFLLPGEVLAVTRAVLVTLPDRAALAQRSHAHVRALRAAADGLGAADRVEMTSRLGPVMPGQRRAPGGRTLTAVFTSGLYHAAVDDLRSSMPSELRRLHDDVGTTTAEVDDLLDLLGACPGALRVAEALAPDWGGTLDEFTGTVRAVA